MPCLCGHKVERSSPKVQCAKCNELFHLSCVNILPSDVEFLLSSDSEFLCKKCSTARRNSLRSPPPSAALDNTVNNITTIYPNSLTTLNSQAHVQSGSLSNSSLHPTTIANSASPSQELKIDNGHEDIAIMRDQLTLRSALAEIAALRAENSRIAAIVNELRDNNIQLLTNTKAMQAEIQSLQSNFSCDQLSSALCTLTAEIKALRENACTCVHNTNKSKKEIKQNNKTLLSAEFRTSPHHVVADCPVLPAPSSAVGVSVNSSHRLPDAASLSFAAAAVTSVTDKVSADFAAASSAVGVNANSSHITADVNSRSYAAAAAAVNKASSIGANTASQSPAQWSTVTGKRAKKQNKSSDVVYGVNCSTELDVVAMKKWIHLSSFKPTVSADDIIGYVVKNSKIDKSLISCFSLIKKDTDVSSLKRINFKLGVVPSVFEQVLNPKLWPANVKVRPFQNFQKDDPPNNKI